MKEKYHLPGIGMRIVKSAIAVFLCGLFYMFFRKDGILFYSQLSALWCMQPLRDTTRGKAIQRTIGTAIGAGMGLIVILIDQSFIKPGPVGNFCYYGLVALAIIVVLYITVLIHKPNASYFSCVVFLSIVVIHIGDRNPYLFVWNRVLDTMIGIAIGMAVNSFRLPYKKRPDILFVSGMDDTLLDAGEHMSDYSRVELNRMISEGAKFTVSTMRTPASLQEPLRGVNLNLPVITMDGAAMYDFKKNEYIRTYIISSETVRQIRSFLDGYGVNYFMNMLIENILIIQYKELKNDAERDIYETLHVSPYRNYTKEDVSGRAECIYFMLIERTETILPIYKALKEAEFSRHLRTITYLSNDYPGYSYIKIYNKNATRDNMVEYLKRDIGITNSVTFGSIEGKYDVVTDDHDSNKVVRTLKRMYEPYIWA
ncbi:MAG: HAD hydrolase family protein [Lachnospiraceae bacterium]|nr:HAD hydrolase family protein [Lachnospiraceae bacterium]